MARQLGGGVVVPVADENNANPLINEVHTHTVVSDQMTPKQESTQSYLFH